MTTQPVTPNPTKRTEFFYPVTYSAASVLWPDYNAGWGLYVKLVGMVTAEVQDPDDKEKRIGIILGGTLFTNAELARRLGCDLAKLRNEKSVLSQVGLLIQRRYQSAYRLAIRCSAKGRVSSIDPKYSWVKEAIAKSQKLPKNAVEPQSQQNGECGKTAVSGVEPQSRAVEPQSQQGLDQQNQQDALGDKRVDKRVEEREEPTPKALPPNGGTHLPVSPVDEEKALDEVWQHYLTATDRNPKLNTFTVIRKHKGLVRLRECLAKTKGNLENAVKLMKLAIDKLAQSDWHMGRDPKTNGKKYADWENHVFKSLEQMEGWWQR